MSSRESMDLSGAVSSQRMSAFELPIQVELPPEWDILLLKNVGWNMNGRRRRWDLHENEHWDMPGLRASLGQLETRSSC